MSAAKQQPWLKWYPADWRAHTKLKMCSLSARGLWVEMLGVMHEAEPYGHLLIDGTKPSLGDLAAIIGRPVKEVAAAYAELQHKGVFSLTDDGTPYSRKMVRDKAKADENRSNGHDGGNPNIPRGTVPKDQRARPFKRTDAPNKTMRVFQMHQGHCHWCATELLFEPDGGPSGFHVDHVVAICDGGTNDESNLVPACAGCNHDRARMDSVGRAQQADTTLTAWTTGVMVGMSSDSKAQMPEARTQTQTEKPEAKASVKKRGDDGTTRTDIADWEPTEADREYAIGQGRDPERVLADIRGWAANAKPRSKRLKSDPSQFWQGWCRRAADRGECGLGGQRQDRKSPSSLIASAREVIAQGEAEPGIRPPGLRPDEAA